MLNAGDMWYVTRTRKPYKFVYCVTADVVCGLPRIAMWAGSHQKASRARA